MAVCPPLPARHGGAGVVIYFVFTPILGIVLGDNKKNKTHTLINDKISIKYTLF
jgi:hypothetical protein